MKTYNQFMKRMKLLQNSMDDIDATKEYANQNMAIAINQGGEMLTVCTMKKGSPVPLTYTFNDIISSEIIEYEVTDDSVAINNNKQNIATVLSENVGKVTGNEAALELVNRIDLKVSFKDEENPQVLLNFLFWEVAKDSEEYKRASEDAKEWHNILQNIIRQKN